MAWCTHWWGWQILRREHPQLLRGRAEQALQELKKGGKERLVEDNKAVRMLGMGSVIPGLGRTMIGAGRDLPGLVRWMGTG